VIYLLLMNSSTIKPGETLAPLEPERALRAISELANLRDEPADFERFVVRWPGFVYVSEDMPGVHIELQQARKLLPGKFHRLLKLRQDIRDSWNGRSEVLTELLLPSVPPEELPPQEAEKYLDRDEETGRVIGTLWSPSEQIVADWRRGRFDYHPQTEFQRALYLLFSRSTLAKVCANPDCPARYFVAQKVTQRYCSDACSKVFQRHWKRKWWAEHGDKWRHSRKKSRRKTGGKG
jgi:hypothetical protein